MMATGCAWGCAWGCSVLVDMSQIASLGAEDGRRQQGSARGMAQAHVYREIGEVAGRSVEFIGSSAAGKLEDRWPPLKRTSVGKFGRKLGWPCKAGAEATIRGEGRGGRRRAMGVVAGGEVVKVDF